VIEGYGLSEASAVLTSNPTGRTKLGSIGVPLPSTELKCVDDAAMAEWANLAIQSRIVLAMQIYEFGMTKCRTAPVCGNRRREPRRLRSCDISRPQRRPSGFDRARSGPRRL
jgi:acyl-CoA synthetase (AMP-forming)/AMP-acid ligase II